MEVEIVDNDQDNDGVCDADEIIGCQDEVACNYMSMLQIQEVVFIPLT